MGKSDVIGILSGKGGVGKTTVVANLGSALASEFNKKALIIDSNVKTSHLGLHLGIYDGFPVTLKEVMLKKVPVMYAIFLHPTTGLRLLPAPMKGDMDLKKMDGIINELKSAYNPIIIDCAPGLGKDVVIAAKSIDKAILVTTPDLPAVTDMLKTINLLKKLKKEMCGIILNRVRNESYELTVDEIESTCGYDVIAIIPETNKIPESIADGVPIVMDSNCPAAIEFKKLAASLVGGRYEPVGVWGRLKNLFRVSKKPKVKLIRELGASKEQLEREDKKLKNEKLITQEFVEEERAAIKELKEDLGKKRELKKISKRAYKGYLEKEVMKKVKEKLKERLS
jgi:septum site-determining protein MinD